MTGIGGASHAERGETAHRLASQYKNPVWWLGSLHLITHSFNDTQLIELQDKRIAVLKDRCNRLFNGLMSLGATITTLGAGLAFALPTFLLYAAVACLIGAAIVGASFTVRELTLRRIEDFEHIQAVFRLLPPASGTSK